jgi:shikimate kinase
VAAAASSRLPARVALIGFMGSGKSTVGRLLAARLGYAFLDLDDWIRRKSGRSVRQIFETEGEEAFRALEAAALREVGARRRLVLAAGGGAPIREANRVFFREAATVYLEISFEEFLRRTAANPDRPLRDRPPAELAALFESRLQVYRELGIRVSSQGRSPREVVEEIVERLSRPKGPRKGPRQRGLGASR